MALAIAPYSTDHAPAVRAFNERLALAGVTYRFPEDRPDSDPAVRRAFVAVEQGDHVRGGYLVREQEFLVNGRMATMGFLQLPLSEGLIDRRYSALGVQLIMHARKQCPLLFGLGIGGYDETFARLVSALGWQLRSVPFLFRVVRPFRVARHLKAIHGTLARRLACEAGAWSGAASIAARLHHLRLTKPLLLPSHRLSMVSSLRDVGDELWDRYRQNYRLIACRDGAALDRLYPAGADRFLRWTFRGPQGLAGWVVALDTPMAGHKYFGDLRVATIVDCFGNPADAPAMMSSVSIALAARGVDLIVTNQTSSIWRAALWTSGFTNYTSNYLFAAAPGLVSLLGAMPSDLGEFHLNRGDGDGPINL